MSTENKITVLGKIFHSEEERRTYFREELRKKLPELKKMEGFPIGEDEDILNLSDPPYYTACPNPWLNDFIAEWEAEKKELEKQGLRKVDFEVTEPYARDIKEGKNHAIYSLHSYHTKVPHPIIMRYLLHYTQPGDIVFDGFGGTGMTGVAAKQCGNAESILKLRLENEYLSNHNKKPMWGERHAIVSDLSPAATFISANLNSKFETDKISKSIASKLNGVNNLFGWMFETLHDDGKKGTINYVVWSEVAECPNCHGEFVIWDVSADTDNGSMKQEFNCQLCSSKLKKSDCDTLLVSEFDKGLGEIVKTRKYQPAFINYSVGKKRYYKKPSKHDFDVIEKINHLDFTEWIPTYRLPEGDESRRNDKFGITNIHQFYTKRNIVYLSAIWSTLDIQEKFIATSVLSRNLTKLNRYVVNQHNPKGRINGPLSGTFYMPSEFVEQNPYDLILSKIPQITWDNHGILTSTNPAQQTNIEANTIDYIFTDPPFGANIMYSELNFIWESWLKVFTDNKPEAIENKTQKKSTLDYQSLMLQCFKEYYRILKPGKWMTVEFSNTSAAVWNGIRTALQTAGFVICDITDINKTHGGIRAYAYNAAVKQDLAITCYKPSSEFDDKFKQNQSSEIGVWQFIEEHLSRIPIHIIDNNSTTAIIERSPKILFDRLIAFYVQRGLPVPIDAGKFQQGLRERFIERDGMFFTNEQVQEYDRKKAAVPNFVQLSIFVANEQDAIYWLRRILEKEPKTEQDLHPLWMKEVAGNMRKGDTLPEMRTILEENFLKNDKGQWYLPDPENEADLEKLRTKRLLKQFETYKTEASKPKSKIKEARVEALRAGFKQCYQEKDFKTIVQIGDRIPNNLLMEDEVLLQFYDIASSRV
ncbi:MAG: DNA methyltransferase [Clostridia bacterium]|nr:DNA methyltransferase [Clostridia bacterium]